MTINNFLKWADSVTLELPLSQKSYLEYRQLFIEKAGKELRLTIPNAIIEFDRYWATRDIKIIQNKSNKSNKWIDLVDPIKGIEVN